MSDVSALLLTGREDSTDREKFSAARSALGRAVRAALSL